MTVSGVSSNIAPLIQSALDINKQLDDLQRQLGSGQKADTYAGLGSQSGIAVALNAQLSALSSFRRHDDECRNQHQPPAGGAPANRNASAVRFNRPRHNRALPSITPARPRHRKRSQVQLDQILGLLNTQGGNGYLFSGKRRNQPSVDTADHILNGNGAAGRPQTGDRRTQSGRPRRRRAWPPGHSGGLRHDRLGKRGRRQFAVWPQARRRSIRPSPERP